MLNRRAKFLLVATSLSPVLGAVAVSQFEPGESWKSWEWCLVVVLALVLPGLCWPLLMYAKKNAPKQLFYIKEFERKDQEMLVFLFIYLLPFIRSPNPTFASEPLTSVYVLAIIIIAIAYADAFHFNPVMRVFGYRFYAAKDRYGISNLLISKRDLRRPGEEVPTVRLAWNVYLYIGDSDAR